jgi:hypothetical protein
MSLNILSTQSIYTKVSIIMMKLKLRIKITKEEYLLVY